jgi:hypothetical protein
MLMWSRLSYREDLGEDTSDGAECEFGNGREGNRG